MDGRKVSATIQQPRSTWPLFAVVALLLAALPLAVWLDLRDLTERTSRRQALDIGTIITDIRGFYATDVVGRILSAGPNGGQTQVVENYHDVPGAVPIPATFSIAIGNLVAGRDSAVRYDFVSDFPFARREPYALTEFQRTSLATFRADPALMSAEETAGGILTPVVQVAFPIRMTEACVSCHNTHPDSPKRDWKVGDIRGIQAVTVTHPVAISIWSFKYLLIYFAFAAASGIGI